MADGEMGKSHVESKLAGRGDVSAGRKAESGFGYAETGTSPPSPCPRETTSIIRPVRCLESGRGPGLPVPA